MLIDDGKKICCQCGDPKPGTSEYFHRMTRGSDGLQNRCKTCCNTKFGNASPGVYRRIGRALGIAPREVRRIERSAFRKLFRNAAARELAR